jgi:hypothetical protein
MRKQLGQSMTEYLVVVGVTGAGLLAATTDVSKLFDNVHRSYSTQSSEMNKVQIYSNPKLQENEVVREDDDGDDGDEIPDTPVPVPEQEYPPYVESVFDEFGNLIGHVKDGYLVDASGEQVATCMRSASGQCSFVDANGNSVFNGATTNTEWVDDDGKPLVLQALTNSAGQVMGFAYLYNGQYHDASSRKRLDPQPSGLTAVQTRPVISYDENGKAFSSGHAINGLIYSESSILSPAGKDFSTAMVASGELVGVVYQTAPSATWSQYKPCLVVPLGWSNNFSSGATLSAGEAANFNNPQPGTSYINSEAASCQGRSTVTLDSSTSNWTLSK